jgi:uncharacterized protein
MIRLARITLYPIKSLDGVDVDSANLLPCGALEHDRQFKLIDEQGKQLNGKRCPLLHLVRATYAWQPLTVSLRFPSGSEGGYRLPEDSATIAALFTKYLGEPCDVVENTQSGFPDDDEALGPTIIGAGSIRRVSDWFGGLGEDEIRRRFRANLKLDCEAPFWEDQLADGEPFTIGAAQLIGLRCPVPTRDSFTGDPMPMFQRDFATRRAAELPATSPREKFDHFYRLSVNTTVPHDVGVQHIAVGDELRR